MRQVTLQKKSVHIFTGVQAGTPQQRAPITAGLISKLRNIKFKSQFM